MKKGFTLIELLVVVLIIGILAAVALPQYEMAVTKSRVATMLPIMHRWYDALALYKLENGDYAYGNSITPDSSMLGVSWPNYLESLSIDTEAWNEQWYCFANEEATGYVYCSIKWLGKEGPFIYLFQPDDPNTLLAGKRVCQGDTDKDKKVCKALGGKLISGTTDYYEF